MGTWLGVKGLPLPLVSSAGDVFVSFAVYSDNHPKNFRDLQSAVERCRGGSSEGSLEQLADGIARICCVQFGAEKAKVKMEERIGGDAASYRYVKIKRTRQSFTDEKGDGAGLLKEPSDQQASKLVASPWAQHLKPSPTLAIKDVADELKRTGAEVFDFGIGEMNPYVPVPLALREAIAAAQMADTHSHYSAATGDSSLLEVLSEDFIKFGMRYSPKQIVVCPGPKDAIFKACVSLINPTMPRHRVVAFAPTYEAFENIPPLVTGKPSIVLDTDERFFPKVDELDRLLSSDTSIAVIIINSPNNPTGAVYPSALIADLAKVIAKHPSVTVISDESYRTAMYNDEPYVSIAHHLPQQTLVVGGISKELSATGLRLGWVAGPEHIIRVIANVNGNATSCVNLPTQIGLAQFLKQEKDMADRKETMRQLKKRREVALSLFTTLPHLKRCVVRASEGAFYLFPNVEAYLHTRTQDELAINTDKDLALYLLRKAKVVAIPGSEFQRPGHLRVCYARDEATLLAGLHAMNDALALLTPHN